MQSPKITRNLKSPRNHEGTGRSQDQKMIKKKPEKTRDIGAEKEKKKKAELNKDLEQMSNRCKYLESELIREKMKNTSLEAKIVSLVSEIQKYRSKQQSRLKDKLENQSVQNDYKSAIKKESQFNEQFQSVNSFQPETPRVKTQVGGYFGSLFN